MLDRHLRVACQRPRRPRATADTGQPSDAIAACRRRVFAATKVVPLIGFLFHATTSIFEARAGALTFS